MATHGSLAPDASQRFRALWLVIVALALPGQVALADQAASGSERFRIEAQLRPAEGRFVMTAELRATTPTKSGRDRFTLKQLQTPDVACEELGDAIFADQFE